MATEYQMQPQEPLRQPDAAYPVQHSSEEALQQDEMAPQPESRSFIFCYGTLHILFADRKFADVTFSCDDGNQVDAHKFILASRSEHFKSALYSKGDTLAENCKHKVYPYRTSSNVLLKIVEYLYTGVIADLEMEACIESKQDMQLWKSLLSESLLKNLGHLDKYLAALLLRKEIKDHAVAASLFEFVLSMKERPQFTQDMRDNLDDIACAMAQTLMRLEFSTSCLRQLSEEELTRVLTAIPFNVVETLVILAVAEWADENLMDEDDEIPGEIMAALDFTCLSNDDLLDKVEKVEHFRAIKGNFWGTVWQSIAMRGWQSESIPNPNRGRGYDWSRRPALLDDAIAEDTISRLQTYTTFLQADAMGLGGGGRPTTIIESAEFGSENNSAAIRE